MIRKPLTFVKYITVEPALCLYFIATAISSMCGLNLLLQKSCHPDIQPSLLEKCTDEVASQKNVTFINAWSKLAHLSIPVIFVIFAGAWSDNNGKRRRPLLILPIIGQIVTDLLCIVNVYFWSWTPLVAALTEGLIPGLTGARGCLVLGANCYLVDITTKENRTFRLGLIVALFFISSPIGAALGGFLYLKCGFYGVFLITTLMNCVALFCIFLFVKNTQLDVEMMKTNKKKFFDPEQALQSITALIKKREGFKRPILLFIVAAMPLTEGPLLGEYSVLYLFVRYMFQWDLEIYGYYAAYKLTLILVGTIIALGLFSRLLRVSDATIGILAAITQISSNIGNAFVTHPYEMFIYPIVDFMHGSSMAVAFSIASKTVDSTEIGRVNGAISALKALVPLIVVPTYNFVYNRTLATFPGSFFLLSAAMGTVLLIIFCTLLFLQRLDQDKPPVVEDCTKL